MVQRDKSYQHLKARDSHDKKRKGKATMARQSSYLFFSRLCDEFSSILSFNYRRGGGSELSRVAPIQVPPTISAR